MILTVFAGGRVHETPIKTGMSLLAVLNQVQEEMKGTCTYVSLSRHRSGKHQIVVGGVDDAEAMARRLQAIFDGLPTNPVALNI